MIDETILASDSGVVFLRGGFDGKPLTLGLSRSPDPNKHPEISVTLSRRQLSALAYELGIIASAEGGRQ